MNSQTFAEGNFPFSLIPLYRFVCFLDKVIQAFYLKFKYPTTTNYYNGSWGNLYTPILFSGKLYLVMNKCINYVSGNMSQQWSQDHFIPNAVIPAWCPTLFRITWNMVRYPSPEKPGQASSGFGVLLFLLQAVHKHLYPVFLLAISEHIQ